MLQYLKTRTFAGLAAAALAVAAMMAVPVGAQDKTPIRIGFGIAQTGPLEPHGKAAMPAMDIWVEETDA